MNWSVEFIVSIVGILVSLISMGVTIYYANNTKTIRDNFLEKLSNVNFIHFVNELESFCKSLSHRQSVKNNNKGGQCIEVFTKIDGIVVDVCKYKERVKSDDKKKLDELISVLRETSNNERNNPTVDFNNLRNLVYDILIIFNNHTDKATKNIVD